MSGPALAGTLWSFECPICPERFASERTKNSHVNRIHENFGRFECSYCPRRFGSESAVEKHERVHTGEKPFKCKICNKRTTSQNNLLQHHIDRHSEKTFRCEVCDKGFGREYTLRRHLVIHSDEKPFHCEQCSKGFPTKDSLRRHHMDLHTVKNFKCDQCGRCFATERSLETHLLNHSASLPQFSPSADQLRTKSVGWSRFSAANEKKRFGCDQCDKSFYLKSSLESHQVRRECVKSTIQRKTVKQNGLVPAKKKIGAKIGRSNGRDGSTGTASSLKTGSAFGTLKKSGESRSQETRRDGGVSVEEASGDRVRHNGIRTKKVKTGDWLPDGEVPDLIVISDKSDQEDDPRPESCAVASAKLKLVFDVGYKAPE